MVHDLHSSAAVVRRPRRRSYPEADVGGKPFDRMYPRWPELCDYLDREIERAVAAKSPPRSLLAQENQFRQFVTDRIQHVPNLLITEEHVPDLLPYLHEEFFGIGVLSAWLDDPEIENLIVDDWRSMIVTKSGRRHKVEPTPWENDQDVTDWMLRVARHNMRVLSEHKPVAAGRLSDGSRFQFILPPISRYASFSLRKHRTDRFDRERYMSSGIAPVEFFEDLISWVDTQQNILISGATNSGKTTMVNFIGSLMRDEERIIIIEDTPELQIQREGAHYFQAKIDEARASRGSEDDAITIADLIRYALRSSPDRIIVGEIRGAEAFDLLRAFNTGHSGGLSTIHANTPSDALIVLDQLASASGTNMPAWAIQDMIGSTIGIVVQLAKDHRTGQRHVVEVSQVLHPTRVLEREALEGTLMVRDERIYVRQLWKWNEKLKVTEKVGDPIPVTGRYFV